MKLAFVYVPVTDMPRALSFYRDTLGLEELWREGDGTVALRAPDDETAVMLDRVDTDAVPGPLFVVDSVLAFYERHRAGLDFVAEPAAIPGGYWVELRDPDGRLVRVLDQSTEAQEPSAPTG
jgi:catechol 2,3-dioxygenase-like lactoylglutathione lyase family enzyme